MIWNHNYVSCYTNSCDFCGIGPNTHGFVGEPVSENIHASIRKLSSDLDYAVRTGRATQEQLNSLKRKAKPLGETIMGKAETAKTWDMEVFKEIQLELPDWMGSLFLKNSVDSYLSPREVRRALLQFASHDWGEGHPERDDNDENLKKGERVFAQYRAKDFSGQPFYIIWTPENYNQRFKSWLFPEPEPHEAYVEVLTVDDY